MCRHGDRRIRPKGDHKMRFFSTTSSPCHRLLDRTDPSTSYMGARICFKWLLQVGFCVYLLIHFLKISMQFENIGDLVKYLFQRGPFIFDANDHINGISKFSRTKIGKSQPIKPIHSRWTIKNVRLLSEYTTHGLIWHTMIPYTDAQVCNALMQVLLSQESFLSLRVQEKLNLLLFFRRCRRCRFIQILRDWWCHDAAMHRRCRLPMIITPLVMMMSCVYKNTQTIYCFTDSPPKMM